MNEYYVEQRVKQKMTVSTVMKIIGLIFSGFLALFIAFVFPLLFMVCVPYAFFVIFLIHRSNYEFEYLFFNGDLDVDRISAKASRKRILSTSVKEIEVLAPTGSIELQRYKNLKKIDCSSNSDNKTYEMVAKKGGQLVRIIFEPNQKILDGVRMLAPRKVFFN